VLEVSAAGLRMGGVALPDEQGALADLAVDLLLGGVREVAIRPGVTEQEIDRFLVAIDPGSDDTATRLLEADLEHVDVGTLDFVARAPRPQGSSPELATYLQESRKLADQVAADFEARGVIGKGAVLQELTDSGGE